MGMAVRDPRQRTDQVSGAPNGLRLAARARELDRQITVSRLQWYGMKWLVLPAVVGMTGLVIARAFIVLPSVSLRQAVSMVGLAIGMAGSLQALRGVRNRLSELEEARLSLLSPVLRVSRW